MTLHGLGSAEAAGGGTGTTFDDGTANDVIVTTPTLDGSRAYKVDPVGGQPSIQLYGWNVAVNSQGNQRLMLASAIIRIADFWDEAVALMELGVGLILGAPTRQLSINDLEKLTISDKDDDEVGSTSVSYLGVDINYHFLWLFDQRNLSDTRDILWVRKPAASIGAITTIAFNDADPDTITDSANGFGIFTAGMIIVVTGGSDNNGTYTIAAVASNGSSITLVGGDTLSTEAAGDSVTIAHADQWYNAIDVTGHGDGVDEVDHLTMGTFTGKGPLPTTGGPFYFTNAVLQNLLVAPNGGSAEPKDDAFGSFACKVKMASANGTFGDFDAGVGAHAHPDWRHVDEIPSNDATDYDEGDVGFVEVITSNIAFHDANPDTLEFLGAPEYTVGETITVSGSVSNDGTYTIDSISGGAPWKITLVVGDTLTEEGTGATVTITQDSDRQSYEIANAGGGEGVLAVQVVGDAAGASSDLTPRPFIYDLTSRQNLPTFGGTSGGRLNDFNVDVTLNQINGVDLSESLFNDLEAGLEIVSVQNGAVLRDSQIALEYAIPGSKALPSDFPDLALAVTSRRRVLSQVV